MEGAVPVGLKRFMAKPPSWVDRLLEEILKRLDITNTGDLLHHEEIVPRNFKRLKEAMFNLGCMVDPIVIDKEHKVVLDGNHRLMVLRDMEVPHAVVQPIDYSSEEITVGTWLPASDGFTLEQFTKNGIEAEKVDREEGMVAIAETKAAFMFGYRENGSDEHYLLAPGSYSLDGLVDVQKEVLKAGNVNGNGGVHYISDDLKSTELEDGKVILFRRSYTKEEIVKRAKEGNPFPPKSTRHLIPNRIIRLNMKLGWLFENRDDGLKLLEGMLANRAYAGNVRRYPEPVIVIY